MKWLDRGRLKSLSIPNRLVAAQYVTYSRSSGIETRMATKREAISWRIAESSSPHAISATSCSRARSMHRPARHGTEQLPRLPHVSSLARLFALIIQILQQILDLRRKSFAPILPIFSTEKTCLDYGLLTTDVTISINSKIHL
jgi:hypothetical protein